MEKAVAGCLPRKLSSGTQCAGPQLCQEIAIFVKHREMSPEGPNISHPVYHGVLQVMALIGACIGDKRNAPATHRLGADKSETLLNAGKDEDVTVAHEVGHFF